jgi:signal transduction histidine kinase
MALRCLILSLLASSCVCNFAGEVLRRFTVADGLAESACLSVTPGASGDVLIRHPGTNAISIFDGFTVTLVPGPDESRHRVFQSPGGQLWTVSPDGLREFWNGEWRIIPLQAIADSVRRHGAEKILLQPVRQGRVLVLSPEELIQYSDDLQVNARIAHLLKSASAGIGPFTNMFVTGDGELMVAGANGQVRSLSSHRALTEQSRWEVVTPKPGEVSPRTTFMLPEMGRASDSIDIAGGVTWLATPECLARISPPLWRQTANADVVQDSPPALTETERVAAESLGVRSQWAVIWKSRTGDVWFGGGNRIARVRNRDIQVFASTNQIGPEGVIAFAETPAGRIRCAEPGKVWEFDGNTWQMLRTGLGRVHSLVCLQDGTMWIGADASVYRVIPGAWLQNDFNDGFPVGDTLRIAATASGEILARTRSGDWMFEGAADTDAPHAVIPPLSNPDTDILEGDAVIVSFAGRDRWDVTTPERLLFSFKLDEADWSPFESVSETLLPDLSVGRHLFQVRAMDRNANVSAPATLEFTVVLPWYRETRLVLVLAAALMVALALAGIAYNRHRKLRLSYAEVERLVAERTNELELAQRELMHSQKMNALGTLSAGIAHDFNNILSIIKGSAQIIEDNPGNEEKIRTRLDRIKTVVQQGAGIVEAMLGFSRPSPSTVAACDVNGIVDDTLKLLGDRFLRGVQLQFARGADLPQIPVAREFVQQALLNFILNAAEAVERRSAEPESAAAERKRIQLRTALTAELPAGLFLKPAAAESYIRISVADNGDGIAPENLSRVFEPFFTTKAMSSQRGTGLGLSMVYELARKLEAGLAVESEPGHGSTFTLLLPVSRS